MFIYLQERIQKREQESRYYRSYVKQVHGVYPASYEDKIERPKMPVWDVKLIENLPGGKKKQIHLSSITYWGIVNGDAKYLIKYDGELYDSLLKHCDKDNLTDEVFNHIKHLLEEKLDILEKRVIDHYKQNFKDELRAIKVYNELNRQLKREKAEADAERKRQSEEYQRKSEEARQQQQKTDQRFFGGGSGHSLSDAMTQEETEMAARIIKKGFRSVAQDCHSDKEGGSDEKFIQLKKVQELLEKLIS